MLARIANTLVRHRYSGLEMSTVSCGIAILEWSLRRPRAESRPHVFWAPDPSVLKLPVAPGSQAAGTRLVRGEGKRPQAAGRWPDSG